MDDDSKSPKKPLIYATIFAALWAIGYRGRFHHHTDGPLSIGDFLKTFAICFSIAFVVVYIARLLGIKIGRGDD